MKGIILAGGAGSRLYPLTTIVTKQLQPVYDKPMIYYPLSTLMLMGIKDFLIISTGRDLPSFEGLLGDGNRFGINIQYCEQLEPKGIAEAFVLGESFLAGEDSCLVLGDNLFYGTLSVFRQAIAHQKERTGGQRARVFAYEVRDPERYGVVEFDNQTGKVASIEEKPKQPRSNYAIPGLYLFDESVAERAKALSPSPRGELEITDLIKTYLQEGNLGVEVLPRGMAWFDTGTPQSLLEAGAFIGAIEQRQGLKIACLEEVAVRSGYLDVNGLEKAIRETPNCAYRTYLERVASEWQ